jgi:hypothetical protein
MVDVRYVGKKPTAFDNVAGSKKRWNGNGDVQEVTADQARRLIKHPDQWALVNEADLDAVNGDRSISSTDEEGNNTKVDEDALNKPLEKMTVSELVVFAKVKFDKDLNPRTGKKLLIDQIEELKKEIGE